MLVELPAGGREVLQPLYRDYPYLHGAVEAGISAAFGEAVADDAQRPSAACIHLDMYFFAGDPAIPGARQIVERIVPRAAIVAPGEDWERLLREVWGNRVEPHERVVYDAPPAWDRARLKEQAASLSPGFQIVRIDPSTVVPSEPSTMPSFTTSVQRSVPAGRCRLRHSPRRAVRRGLLLIHARGWEAGVRDRDAPRFPRA